MELKDVLSQPESKTLEFKRDLSSLPPILKTLVAFANTAGGMLIIGRSSDGQIVGIGDVFSAEERIANAISDSIRPALLPEIEIATQDGKNLLVIKVAHWRGPFHLKSEGVPRGVYIRLGSTSRPAGEELLAELQRSILHQSFDEQPLAELAPESLEIEQAVTAFSRVSQSIDERKLRSLGLLVLTNGTVAPSIGGMLLFGRAEDRNHLFPDARIRCARFRGRDKSTIIDSYEVEGGLLNAVDEVPRFIARNTRLAAQISGMRREDLPEYPIIALREALINAFAHTDYSLTGGCTQIAIFEDRLEIQNTGMLPFGFTIEDLKTGVSRVRNRVIARVFSELGLMEEWGSGYKRMIEACKEGGYPDPIWEELGSAIRVTFYPHPETSLTPPQESLPHQGSLHRNQKIMELFHTGAVLSFRDVFDQLGESISERTLRYDLSNLRDAGLLVSEGRGPATRWRIAPEYLRHSSEPE